MRPFVRSPLAFLASLAALLSPAASERMLKSSSLNTCQQNSQFSASLFNVVYTPSNGSANINVVATSSIQGNVKFDISAYAYGYNFLNKVFDPCTMKISGLCPMMAGQLTFDLEFNLGEAAGTDIPSIAYEIPDLDAQVQVFVNMSSTGESVACVQADISNGKTVNLLGVKWATAVIAGLGLVASAIVSGLGHTNAAAHVAANSLSLFGYFQAQAIVGLTGVALPPIVQSWTQDFQWSMGIIHLSFMQSIFTWYQRSTGGTPSTLFDSLTTRSVDVVKRSIPRLDADGPDELGSTGLNLFKRSVAMSPQTPARAARGLVRRGNIMTGSGSYIVYGIQRVAFRAHIESTNLFMTAIVFFCLLNIVTIIFVAAFKGYCEMAIRNKWMHNDRFLDFRNGWLTVLKGILFRIAVLGFPPVTIMCLWEFTQVDSVAEVVLAVFFLFGLLGSLGWGASKVIRIARRSVAMHRNPAYILFSDPQTLNKWGFLYIQFRASAYYFIVPFLGYILVKAMLIAFAQSSGITQAIGLIIIEAAALIAASVFRPWMDKPTTSFNIAIYAVNFINAICLLIYTNVFGAPKLVIGVVGVVLFVLNAAFSLILLLMVIISTTVTFFRKNPDSRYQFMADDRASFMKSQTQLNTTTELDALAATARGDKAGFKSQLDLDDDNDSLASDDIRRRADDNGYSMANHSPSQPNFPGGPRSPVNPSMPLFPGNGQRPQSPFRSASPSPYNGSGSSLSQSRAQNNASPWQRGAGYDH